MSDKERVRREAIEVFGSEAKADHWLTTYHAVFSAEPIKFMETTDGAAEVMKVLGAIKFGGVV